MSRVGSVVEGCNKADKSDWRRSIYRGTPGNQRRRTDELPVPSVTTDSLKMITDYDGCASSRCDDSGARRIKQIQFLLNEQDHKDNSKCYKYISKIILSPFPTPHSKMALHPFHNLDPTAQNLQYPRYELDGLAKITY